MAAISGPLADLNSALTGTGAVIAGVAPGQWTAPTPCTEFDVRAVVNHLVAGNRAFTAYVAGDEPPPRGADLLGDDPVAAYSEAAMGLLKSFGAKDALNEIYKAPFGSAPGAVLVQVRVLEQLAHGWDIARATGQSPDFPDDVAERALAVARQTLATRPNGPAAPFGPEVPAPGDAPVLDRLAAFLGRAV